MDRKVKKAGEKIQQYLKGRKAQEPVRALAMGLKGDKKVFQYGGKKVDVTDVKSKLDKAADERDRQRAMMRDRQTKGKGHDPSDFADSYSPEGETLSEVDSSTPFADRVMNRVYEAIVFDTDRSGSGVKGKVTGKGKRERGEGSTVKIRYSGGNAGEKGYDAEARVKNLAKNMKAARAKERSGRGGLSVRKGDPVNMRNLRKED